MKRLQLITSFATMTALLLSVETATGWDPRLERDINPRRIKELANMLTSDVVMHKHVNGDGEAHGFLKGDRCDNFSILKGWNDEASSVRILKEGVKVTLFEHKNFGGKSVTFDKPGLYNLTDHGFNDVVSSIVVEK